MGSGEEIFMRRMLKQAHSYPHVQKIHRNLHLILAIATSVVNVEEMLSKKKKLPKRSGTVPFYPNAVDLVKNYGILLQEILVETAVFIRAHDEFWDSKGGGKWSKVLQRSCGTSEYMKGDKETISLGLREACDKLIHHTHFDIGHVREEKVSHVLLGAKSASENG